MLPIVLDNPVLTREMRRRMRGKAMIYSLITYVAALCVVTLFILLINSASMLTQQANSKEMLDAMKKVGVFIYNGMVVIQSILVLILAPAITASLITSERERGTADFLRVTTLPPAHYIVGSFLSTILYVILLLACALPVVSITLLFGGRSMDDILITFGALLVGSIVLSALGIYISSIREKTRTAQGAMMAIAIVFVALILSFPNIVSWFSNTYGLQAKAGAFGQTQFAFFQTIVVPDWLFAAAIPIGFSLVMLVVAGRKVYNLQNRPLKYWQFLIVAAATFLPIAGLFWLAPKNMQAALNIWFAVSIVMFLLAAVAFSLYHGEVGSENWRIHQRLPILAILDDSILYMFLLTALWWFFGHNFFEIHGDTFGRMFDIYAVAIVPPFIMLALIGRLLSHRFYFRQISFRVLMIGAGIIWVLAPLIIYLTNGLGSIPTDRSFLAGVLSLSPLFSYFQLNSIDFMKDFAIAPSLFRSPTWPGHLAAFLYIVISIVLYGAVIYKNWRWKREMEEISLAELEPYEA